MGVLKFLLPSNDLARRLPGFRKAYITGLDRTPGRLSVEFRNGLMACFRETSESGRLFVPWPIAGYGTPIVGTATLAERPSPYVLAARAGAGQAQRRPQPDGRLGADGPADLARAGARSLAEARRAFIQAAMSADEPEACLAAAQASLEASSRAGDLLTEAYLAQILQNRLAATGKLSTHLGCVLTGDPDKLPVAAQWPSAFNACQIGVSWKQIAPSEGKYRWDLLDAQLAWCRRNRLDDRGRAADRVPPRGPARLDLALGRRLGDDHRVRRPSSSARPSSATAARSRSGTWCTGRPRGRSWGCPRRSRSGSRPAPIQVARQADPSAQLSIGVDRPWAEWMSSSHFQLGPLHLCDYLLRSDLGISSIGDRDRAGVSRTRAATSATSSSSPSCWISTRCSNVPLHLFMAIPSAAGPDPNADPSDPGRRVAVAGAARRGHCSRPGGRGGWPWPWPSRSSDR